MFPDLSRGCTPSSCKRLIYTFPVIKRLYLQTTAIFSSFYPVIAPREHRCRCRFIFRRHAPPTLASMESRACVTRKNVCVSTDSYWLRPGKFHRPVHQFWAWTRLFVDAAKIKQECMKPPASVRSSVCV